MLFGSDPGFERRPGGKGLENNKSFGIHHDPPPKVKFLLNRIAIDTPPVVVIISTRLF
jgi:hypothetical protein